MAQQYTEALVNRFLRYVAIPSESVPKAKVIPSSEGQWKVAQLVAEELKALGLQEVDVDEHACVTAFLPGNVEGVPAVGFSAHMDTVPVGLSDEVHAQVIHYEGGDVCLNAEKDLWIRVTEHPELNDYVGQDIVFTDGTSVLGADNKAGLANIMQTLEILIKENRPHGDIRVAFVPDEEIGLFGSKALDLDKFKVDFAYTIDGAERGEVVVETFNAGEVRIEIDGVTAHPISAKGVMVNPLIVATDIMSHFDRLDTPEHTEGREGYFWFKTIQSTPRHATLNLNIRDFDLTQYEARKQFVRDVIKFEQVRHPKAKIVAHMEDIYGNISSFLGDDRTAIDVIYEALDELGIKPITKPMRGGTDGSALSARGLVTPNYFTGAHNFHSSAEFLPIPSFTDSLAMTLKLVELLAKKQK